MFSYWGHRVAPSVPASVLQRFRRYLSDSLKRFLTGSMNLRPRPRIDTILQRYITRFCSQTPPGGGEVL